MIWLVVNPASWVELSAPIWLALNDARSVVSITAICAVFAALGVDHPTVNLNDRTLIYAVLDKAGVPADKRVEALGRGKRLDESTPGTGLGLSIVNDLADMYEGTLTLDVSEWGGLKAVLDLPASVEEKTDKPDSWTDKLHLPHLPSRETRRKK